MQKTMSGKINTEIEECVRNNVTWQHLPIHLKQVNIVNFVLFLHFFSALPFFTRYLGINVCAEYKGRAFIKFGVFPSDHIFHVAIWWQFHFGAKHFIVLFASHCRESTIDWFTRVQYFNDVCLEWHMLFTLYLHARFFKWHAICQNCRKYQNSFV